jgi:hypothetical protein
MRKKRRRKRRRRRRRKFIKTIFTEMRWRRMGSYI